MVRTKGYALLCLLTAGISGWLLPNSAKADAPNPVKVGVVQSLFRDVPIPLARIVIRPFGSLMKEFTGLNGQMHIAGDALTIAKDLDSGKYHLGVFTGVEFAWAKKQNPNLRPIMIAVGEPPNLSAMLMVKKTANIDGFQNLQGKTIAMPVRSKIHCHLFMQKGCAGCGEANPDEFFGKVVRHLDVESALDDVALGKIDGVIVDDDAIEYYRLVKPAWLASLKAAKRSVPFPSGVVAYHKGKLDEATIDRFRQGMLRANKSERGRRSMKLFKITAFQAVPANYSKALQNILRLYPSPEVLSPTSATKATR